MNIDFLSNINWTILIDWILRIIQIITFIGVIIKISFQNEEYIDNVEIKSITPMEFDPLHSQFHLISEFNHETNENSTNHYLFYPKNVDIKKVDFFSLSYEQDFIEEKIFTLENLKNETCLVIHTSLPGVIPNLRMKWETSKGELGEYTFYVNGYNGNTNISSYKYKLTFRRKILAVFGL